MAIRNTPTKVAPSPTRKDMEAPVALHPLPFEEAGKAILRGGPVDRPTTKIEKSA